MHQILEQLLKMPKSIYRIASLFLLLIDAIALDLSHILQKIQIYSVADAYNTLVGVWPEASQFAIKYKWVSFILTIITVFLSFYKPHMIMIRHLSLSIDLAPISAEIKKKYSIKTVIINQVAQMKEDTDIAHAISDQDAKIKQVLETRRSAELCYYGIAHIPLIFRLGFSVGDQNNVKLLHKKRNNSSVFEEWDQEPSALVIEHNEENQFVESDELIVTIATSLEIEPDAVSSLYPLRKHILHFKSHNISFDNITSYKEAENARKYIVHHIRATYNTNPQ